ncbi:DUF881 domain-containing protein [Radiobacillus kanasensis]|uniref:DUF881 domain-containing protein n=1 Tax=Radiobacillus kanasensis TaxID=2844358 RepID=UPI001E3D3F17|nr:DUF881 domain-containing protein [Radiobacillus kanasensis]UFU00946.1 DUF881 domain-containing protein [Radiobacillus kanasensis]
MKLKGRHVILSLVFLVFGFLLSFSYQQTQQDSEVIQLSDQEWEKDFYYLQQLNNLEDKNNQLRNELEDKRHTIQELESNLAKQEEELSDYVTRKSELQMYTGELPIMGKGIQVTLTDSEYIPDEENANKYMVHERHIHQVVNELYSAGAEAISINGHRLYRDSYISCIGPVISVDGTPYPAPFTIEAIGDTEVLMSSITLTNGVVDLLVAENIEVEVEQLDQIEMRARTVGEG